MQSESPWPQALESVRCREASSEWSSLTWRDAGMDWRMREEFRGFRKEQERQGAKHVGEKDQTWVLPPGVVFGINLLTPPPISQVCGLGRTEAMGKGFLMV